MKTWVELQVRIGSENRPPFVYADSWPLSNSDITNGHNLSHIIHAALGAAAHASDEMIYTNQVATSLVCRCSEEQFVEGGTSEETKELRRQVYHLVKRLVEAETDPKLF